MSTLSQVPTSAPDRSTRTEILDIGGMTCGACAVRIANRLNKLPGVAATVNYASERAMIQVADTTSTEELIAEVQSAGYQATPPPALGAPAAVSDKHSDRERSLRRRMFVALALVMPLMDGTIVFSFYPDARFAGWQWLMAALAIPVVTWCAWPFYRAALAAARHGTTTMDTLVSIGIVASTALSVIAMFWPDLVGASMIYFDVSAGVVLFLLVGRYFEARSKRQSGEALEALVHVAAPFANLIASPDRVVRVDARTLRVGDQFLVRAGETVPTDGVVETGSADLNTAAMTGESAPVSVATGDRVAGGTVCIDGMLTINATAVGDQTALGRMIDLVVKAQDSKAAAQRLADRISSVFVPTVLFLALATLVGWLLTTGSWPQAINATLSVLIIACPCALGLATSTALMVSSGTAAKVGIFFKGYQALELTRSVDVVAIDKTGTLTDGEMRVGEVVAAPGYSSHDVLAVAASLERSSTHPVARAITAASGDRPVVEVADVRVANNRGIRGTADGVPILVGTPALLAEAGIQPQPWATEAVDRANRDGRTPVLVSRDGVMIGCIVLHDQLRDEASHAIDDLHSLGLTTCMVTGDGQQRAREIAGQLNIDEVYADVSPSEKSDLVARLQRGGHRVAMVGDGINDAPALATADLGIAVGTGTDVAIATADIIISGDDLRLVGAALLLARRTHSVIRTNLVWAFGYNVVAIPVAAMGWLNPLISGAAMAFSSAFVVWNSSRLRRIAPKGRIRGLSTRFRGR